MEHTKVFVLDTNILVQDPHAVEKLGQNDVIIPLCVIEELDKLKNDPVVGDGARLASRQIDEYRKTGSLQAGVPKKNGGCLFVDSRKVDFRGHPFELEETNDNRIVLVALRWMQEAHGETVVKSNDVNVRIIANALGIASEEYEYDTCIIPPSKELYSGMAVIDLNQESKVDVLAALAKDTAVDAETVFSATGQKVALLANQCCFIKRPGGAHALALFRKHDAAFVAVRKPRQLKNDKGIWPVNSEQAFAYELLSNPNISLITLRGRAGSGKTLMALLAGYEQLAERYEQLLVYRPNLELGRPLGFLPGTLGEKFQPWTQPIIDNLDLIIRRSGGGSRATIEELQRGKRRSETVDTKAYLNLAIAELAEQELLDIAPINFLRGRSLHHRFIVIDEAQNLTPHEVKTIITRVGVGSKMVLTGDTDQIDNRYLNSISNGLSYVIEKFKGQEVFGHITLKKTERSSLAELAANLL